MKKDKKITNFYSEPVPISMKKPKPMVNKLPNIKV